jgi:hypothetical protein
MKPGATRLGRPVEIPEEITRRIGGYASHYLR